MANVEAAEKIESIRICGVSVHDVSLADTLEIMGLFISEGSCHYICTPNASHIVQCQRDLEFRAVINGADLAIPDGMGVVYASHILGRPLKGLVGGRLLVPAFCEIAADKGYRVFLLGAGPGVADRAAEVLSSQYPGLDIAGTYAPPYRHTFDPGENETMVDSVNAARPDVLFVALGSPKQEKFMAHNKSSLNVPVCVGVGAAFDIISGNIPLPPGWMTRWGLEWVFRLWHDPRRLWPRYVLGNPQFVLLILRERLSSRR